MHNTIIIRYGELALKGANRGEFEKQLVRNLRAAMHGVKFGRIQRKRGRIYIDCKEVCDKISNVFGITSYSYAVKQKFDMEFMKMTIVKLLLPRKFETFRVSAHRIDKVIKQNSQELNIEFGQFIVDHFGKKVSLKEHDVDVGIEIYGLDTFIYIDRHKGPGGLPLGTNGESFALIDGKNSILASWFLMRRGVKLHPAATNEEELSLLEKYNFGNRQLKVKNIKNISEIPKLSKIMKINSIVTGHTLENYETVCPGLLQLSPLVGMSQEIIDKELNKI